jgi:adenylate cyclase
MAKPSLQRMPPTKAKKLLSLRWLLLLPIPFLWCVASRHGALDFLEHKFTDWRFQFRGELPSPLKVIYVDIDSQSIDEIGGWPWSRAYFARVAQALISQAHVKAVGYDLVMSDNGVSESVDREKLITGNREFASYLWKNPPVVLAASYSAAVYRDINGKLQHRDLPLIASDHRPVAQMEPPELPAFNVGRQMPWNPPNIGLIDTLDGGTRWVALFAPSNIRTYYHLSIELARLYYGLGPEGIQVRDDRLELAKPDGTVLARVPLIRGQLMEVNWFSPWLSGKNNPRIGFSTVYNYAELLKSDKPAERAAALKFFGEGDWRDAVVLVGPTDPLLQDLAATPFDAVPVPKVGVHGNLLKTIISGKFIRHLSPLKDDLIVFALTALVAGLALVGGGRGILPKIMALLAAALYVAAAFQLFRQINLVLPLAAPLGSAFTTSFAALIWQVLDEQKQKGRIKGMFGAYVSPELVNRMIESGDDPQLGGHDSEITAYFSDIQSFSTFSEVLGSGPLVELMNEYLTACTDIVQEEGGTLDKYIGDAVVAMFGAPIPAPDHALRACVATQRVHQKLAELRTKWAGEGQKWPEIVWKMQTRIGLNTGLCMIGNMGSRTRFNYTMMGDNVNLAARMESGAKSWGCYTMCTETTKQACETHGAGRLVFRRLGRIVVKGRTQAVPIHEIVGLAESVSGQTRECVRLFEEGLDRHDARDWNAAQACFERSRELEPNQPGVTPGVASNPSLVYLRIVADYRTNPPPAGWDGVRVMTEK